MRKYIDSLLFVFFWLIWKLSVSISAPNSGNPSRSLSQPQGDRTGKTLGRNPTIKISRATRVSEQWNASLDREITNANELRHLDEFLGNQVHNRFRRQSGSFYFICLFIYLFPPFVGQWFPYERKVALGHRGHLCHSHYAVQRDNKSHVFPPSKSIWGTWQRPTERLSPPLPHCSPVLSQKPTIGYKGLMTGYQNKVIHLAGEKQKEEVKLVVNLFQSVLDGFIRGEMKKEEAEPAKV